MRQYDATIHREPSPEERRWCVKGHRGGHPCSASARHTARPRVTPAVVAPGLATFPVKCGANEEDSLIARGEHDTSDKDPAHRAAMLYTQHVQVEESRRSVDTS
jgi:hypothetical protein